MRLSRDCTDLPLRTLIDASEQVLGTTLQTAVKRADEQAFALANGQNLMFCEKEAAETLARAQQAWRRRQAWRKIATPAPNPR